MRPVPGQAAAGRASLPFARGICCAGELSQSIEQLNTVDVSRKSMSPSLIATQIVRSLRP